MRSAEIFLARMPSSYQILLYYFEVSLKIKGHEKQDGDIQVGLYWLCLMGLLRYTPCIKFPSVRKKSCYLESTIILLRLSSAFIVFRVFVFAHIQYFVLIDGIS